MSYKQSVMAQADVDIQRTTLTDDAGRRLGMSVIPANDLQVFKFFFKKTGEMEP
ncbi:MAG: hypothetical protein A4E74_00093 [Syntrophus sp. PtaB.Bin075]|nr:MAG: hypothetical protein A4E74_00093 [Syntrophus sp. PtaB.Bin075]